MTPEPPAPETLPDECPFCHSDDFEIFGGFNRTKSIPYFAMCGKCKCRTKNCETAEDALKTWNTRAPAKAASVGDAERAEALNAEPLDPEGGTMNYASPTDCLDALMNVALYGAYAKDLKQSVYREIATIRAALQRPAAQNVPEGMVLVPVEPDDEMRVAGGAGIIQASHNLQVAYYAYRAMVSVVQDRTRKAAAPQQDGGE